MVLDDLKVFLAAAGLGLVYGTNLFKGPMVVLPVGNGPFVSLIRAGGLGTEGTHNSPDRPAYERPIVQVVTRARNYDAAETMANSVYLALFPIRNQLVNDTFWRSLVPRSEPFDLPPDERGLPRIAFNIDCIKRISPATS